MCEVLFLIFLLMSTFLFILLNLFLFFNEAARLDFTDVHQLKWFGAGWRKWGGRNACLGRGRRTVHCVSCCTKQTPVSKILTHRQLLPFVSLTWKHQWRRMALAFSHCLCLLQCPLVSAAVGLFCTWQLRAGGWCVQGNWMMWYCFPSSWCQQLFLGPHLSSPQSH